jgi:Ca2+-binding RTX toxin-like protein
MRALGLFFVLGSLLVLGALLLAGAAGAGAGSSYYPNSIDPVWLSNDLIRFETNLATDWYTGQPYVVAPDGTGMRPATAAEAAAQPASPTPYSPDGQTSVLAELVGKADAEGWTLYAAPTDGSHEPIRLTPTPCTIQTASGFGASCLDGTDGPDLLVGTVHGDLFIAGSGADTIRAGDGENTIQAQWGNDDIRSGSGPDFVDAGAGNDTILTGAGSDHIIPGPGTDTVYAGRGDDYIYGNDGQRDVIDCGPGDDRVRADKIDVLHHCEHVYIAPPGPPAIP